MCCAWWRQRNQTQTTISFEKLNLSLAGWDWGCFANCRNNKSTAAHTKTLAMRAKLDGNHWAISRCWCLQHERCIAQFASRIFIQSKMHTDSSSIHCAEQCWRWDAPMNGENGCRASKGRWWLSSHDSSTHTGKRLNIFQIKPPSPPPSWKIPIHSAVTSEFITF